MVITGANGLANGVYYVLTSTNAALPVTQWTLFGVSAFDSHGNFTLTLPYSPGDRERFYSIESQ